MSCPHFAGLTAPTGHQNVYKEECTVCFDSQDSPDGVLVCLHCFSGGCPAKHAALHARKTGHHVFLRIRRIELPKDPTEPEKKITKLAIGVEGGASTGEPEFEFITDVTCLTCGCSIDKSAGNLPFIIDGVMTASTMSVKEKMKAWESQPKPCQHTLQLVQSVSGHIAEKSRAKCSQCDISEDLWLCVVCGFLGCSRRQAGAGGQLMGGNNHALEHATSSGHGFACKMGTITPDGNADLWCYLCDDGVQDPKLVEHLAAVGIVVADEKKTAQSIQEMELEGSLKLLQGAGEEDGKELVPAYGPGLTGMHNLGNSCYLASVMQCLFSLPAFTQRYAETAESHFESCRAAPESCFHCQMSKLGAGLTSGRYSHADPAEGPKTQQPAGVSPAMFKSLIGQAHPEFSTGRQQDAMEFFQHVLKICEQREHALGAAAQDPTTCFNFEMESRLQCTNCKRVRYSKQKEACLSLPLPEGPVGGDESQPPATYALGECLQKYFTDEAIECACAACGSNQVFTKRWRVATFPDVLLLSIRRETFVGWVPKKLDTRVEPPEEFAVEPVWRATGPSAGEEELPQDAAAAGPQVDSAALSQLMGMGFPEIRCTKALLATGNSGAETAMQWLFEHMEDPDIDAPIAAPAAAGGAGASVSADSIAMVTAMGFSEQQAKYALKQTDGNIERAVDWLFSHPDDPMDDGGDVPSSGAASNGNPEPPAKYELTGFVWHKGSSIHCGHYIAYCKKDGKWVKFNDDKVGVSIDPSPAKQGAYMYFYRAIR